MSSGLVARAVRRTRALLPRNAELTDADWWVRHRLVLAVLWLHVPRVALFATLRGKATGQALLEAGVVGGVAALATQGRGTRPLRTLVASVRVVVTSAILVYTSGGRTEIHF